MGGGAARTHCRVDANAASRKTVVRPDAVGRINHNSRGSIMAGRPGVVVIGGFVTLPPRRIPPSRDSLVKLRATYVAQVLHDIAGRENEPAEQVFKNVQVLKGITAAELVTKMDKEYATALSWNCTNCHRFANQGNWASDTSENKRRARFMQQMEDDIN